MSINDNELISNRIKIKFLLPIIALTIGCCLVILVFSVLLLSLENSRMYIFGEMVIILIVLATCIFIIRYITKSLLSEVIKAGETARKAVEDKNMLANIKDIMNSLDVMIYVTDPETDEILFMNQSMMRHYNLTGDPVGQICYKVLQEGLVSRCSFCPCIRLDNNPGEVVVWNENSSLTNRTYRNVDRYIKWPNGHAVHIQHSIDITELITAKEAAESSNRSKGFFLAQMSHEIRTPMNAILGISEIQLMDKKLSSKAEEGYRKIYESGNLLLNIINDILDFSKIDAGKLEIFSERYDIPSLINDSIQLNRMRFQSKNISFNINLDENTPLELIGDQLRIKQILFNLLSNAFKYTDVGEVELSVHAEDGQNDETVIIVFRVCDTGQGMTESQISRIFEEYTRFNMETNRSISGTGLGMSITKRLVDLMNGEIHVESKPGEGSVFSVRLPQIRCGTGVCGGEVVKNLHEFKFRNISLQKKSQITHEHMPYGKVLVVDDIESNLLVAKGFLTPYGLNIETVKSGFEAIEKIENDKNYDIVFMDYMMPRMDGIKTTKILRSMGYTHPIIALTANAVVGQDEVFLANGFDGFISKPIDSRELNKILIELIRNKKLQKGADEVKLVHDSAKQTVRNDAIAAATLLDINNAIAVLEEILPKINDSDTADMELFITTVHGMKSALANIEEKQLSETALMLERAGNNGNLTVILSETNEFIKSLRSITEKIEKNKQKENGEISLQISNDDKNFLNEKLDAVKSECQNFNIKEAKTLLNGLMQRKIPYKLQEILNEISMYIIRGEYLKVEAAVNRAKELIRKRIANDIQA